MNPIFVIKTVTDLAVAAGTGSIVANLIKTTTPAGMGTLNKVLTGVGAVVLTSAAGSAASSYAVAQIDATVDTIMEIKSAKGK